MMRAFARSLGLALILVLAGVARSGAQTDVQVAVGTPGSPIDVSFFYQNLANDGQWFQDPAHGWCWTPYDMTANWKPYTVGHWEYTDDGWSWASDEPFGWATYHYGRWFFSDVYGWAWMPGTEWAPAWVAWRSTDNDDYVGWAPLPPDAGWDATAGLSFGDVNAIPEDEWCFVPQEHLLDVSLNLVVAPEGRDATLFGRSHDATRFAVRDGRPANIGFDVSLVEKRIGHPVPRERIADVDAPARGEGRDAGYGAVGFYRPKVQASTQAPPAEITQRGNAIPDADFQRMRDTHQQRLESDLTAERARMVSEQNKELQAQGASANAAALKAQHAAEQKAFDAHAAKQRQVMTQRMQKRVVRPGNPPANGQGNGKDRGNGGR